MAGKKQSRTPGPTPRGSSPTSYDVDNMPSSYAWRPGQPEYYNAVALAASSLSATTGEHVSRNEVINMAVENFFSSGAYEQVLHERSKPSEPMAEAIRKLSGGDV